ncbi:hypothetical protein [Thalassospira xiamenensis]|uniref:hypothetical protein n=1 Tax=Thalassospira xiamenensis TaxID=220697 RepID=UPI000E08B606|nr:hypothetical protein [Thalassospira xiamenensis]RCK37306.1 hypothetical protein TH24_17205 [Thalassospira xiamenensis]
MTGKPEEKADYEYRHDLHCPEWTPISWPYSEDDLALELAEDWADDEEDESEIYSIAEDVEIRRAGATDQAG